MAQRLRWPSRQRSLPRDTNSRGDWPGWPDPESLRSELPTPRIGRDRRDSSTFASTLSTEASGVARYFRGRASSACSTVDGRASKTLCATPLAITPGHAETSRRRPAWRERERKKERLSREALARNDVWNRGFWGNEELYFRGCSWTQCISGMMDGRVLSMVAFFTNNLCF